MIENGGDVFTGKTISAWPLSLSASLWEPVLFIMLFMLNDAFRFLVQHKLFFFAMLLPIPSMVETESSITFEGTTPRLNVSLRLCGSLGVLCVWVVQLVTDPMLFCDLNAQF